MVVNNKYIGNVSSSYEEFAKAIQDKHISIEKEGEKKGKVIINKGKLAERVVSRQLYKEKIGFGDRFKNFVLNIFSKEYRTAKLAIKESLKKYVFTKHLIDNQTDPFVRVFNKQLKIEREKLKVENKEPQKNMRQIVFHEVEKLTLDEAKKELEDQPKQEGEDKESLGLDVLFDQEITQKEVVLEQSKDNSIKDQDEIEEIEEQDDEEINQGNNADDQIEDKQKEIIEQKQDENKADTNNPKVELEPQGNGTPTQLEQPIVDNKEVNDAEKEKQPEIADVIDEMLQTRLEQGKDKEVEPAPLKFMEGELQNDYLKIMREIEKNQGYENTIKYEKDKLKKLQENITKFKNAKDMPNIIDLARQAQNHKKEIDQLEKRKEGEDANTQLLTDFEIKNKKTSFGNKKEEIFKELNKTAFDDIKKSAKTKFAGLVKKLKR